MPRSKEHSGQSGNVRRLLSKLFLCWSASYCQLNVPLTRLLPEAPRNFRTTIVTNASPDSSEVVERSTAAGATTEQTRELGLTYPEDAYSLSHVALPFPTSDSLYGSLPDPTESFGVHLGAIAGRGERGTLIVSLDVLFRMASNPFFPYMMGRIEQFLSPGASRGPAATIQ